MYLSDKKKRFCNELEEAIKMLVHKLFSIIKELEKLINTGKQLGGFLAVSIIILILDV